MFRLKGIIFTSFFALSILAAQNVNAQSINVAIYDGPASLGNILTTVTANQPRPDVNAAFGITGDHGFSWAVPQSLQDGKSHNIYVYGINSNPAGSNTLLNGAPMTLQCGTVPPAATPSVSIIASPTNVPSTGGSVDLFWSTTQANSCVASGNWSGTKILEGSETVTIPAGSSQQTYTLTCTNDNGSASDSAFVSVGNSSDPAFCTTNPQDPSCVGGGGNGNGVGNVGGGQTAGFTVSGTTPINIQFIANLPGTSKTSNLSVNPVSGFTAPVLISVQSIRSASGADLPAGNTPTYYFGGQEASSVVMTYDAASGYYMNPSGTIGTTFAVKLPIKITEKYLITLIGSSGAQSVPFVIELDPLGVNPSFQEL